MGAWYSLINFTKREQVDLVHLGGVKAREIACTHPAAAIAIWYMLRNRGDQMAFVSDYDVGRTFFGEQITYELLNSLPDRCEETIAHAVESRVVTDHGKIVLDEAEPDLIYRRDVRIDPGDGNLPLVIL